MKSSLILRAKATKQLTCQQSDNNENVETLFAIFNLFVVRLKLFNIAWLLVKSFTRDGFSLPLDSWKAT